MRREFQIALSILLLMSLACFIAWAKISSQPTTIIQTPTEIEPVIEPTIVKDTATPSTRGELRIFDKDFEKGLR